MQELRPIVMPGVDTAKIGVAAAEKKPSKFLNISGPILFEEPYWFEGGGGKVRARGSHGGTGDICGTTGHGGADATARHGRSSP